MNEASSSETRFDPVRLVQTHQAGLWRYLKALGCDAAEADDLAQETFLAILQKPFFEYSQAATAGYLRKVAFNLFVTMQRRSGKVTAVEDIEQFDKSWSEWAGNDNGEEMVDALRGCLQSLTERARWALQMRFQEKRSRMDIASALEITEHGAKNLMQRAKQQLKACIESKLT